MKQKIIPVFFAVDDQYAPYLAVALKSLIANTTATNRYQLIVLYHELSPANQKQLQTLALTQPQINLKFVPLTNAQLQKITDHDNKLRCDYFTFTIYFRLFIATMFPEYDKAIYLDADTVVLADIADLYQIELGNQLLGAVPDPFIAANPKMATYAADAVGVTADKYVNSGVLLMNLKAMRTEHFAEHFLSLLNEYHFASLAPDQDYLNAISQQRIRYLDPAWNVQMNDTSAAPQLVHYNLFAKPWHYDDVANQQYFWHYARMTPYYDQIVATKQRHNVHDTQQDDAKLQQLLSMAQKTIHAAITFKSVRDQGNVVYL
ncbi:glycosyltransferase family 8 protein [Loigolactobacillus jiayinensis]|uniref:Glycosyltransferase family 8 protein n=1 Tax=Loigolactobacillus jiayinensis TaxID=2486016 RepID=A0ABW1RDF1_9LACO|nr:glycosyltransferase family 8 protein [Loigolactobacillus jiayinensis]